MTGAANEYAKALFSLTEELGTTDKTLRDLRLVDTVLSENPSYIKLTDTPALSVPEKLTLLDEAFDSIDESLKNLIKILCERHSVHLFPALAKRFLSLYNESRGIIPAEVISATKLSDSAMAKLKEKLEVKTKKTVVLTNTVDESIIGGVKLRYDGIQLDGSLRARLDAIEKSLKSTIV